MVDDNSKRNENIFLAIVFITIITFAVIYFVGTEYELIPPNDDLSDVPHYKVDTYNDIVEINLNDVYGEKVDYEVSLFGRFWYIESLYPTLTLEINSREFIRSGKLLDYDTITIMDNSNEITYLVKDINAFPILLDSPLMYTEPVEIEYKITKLELYEIIDLVRNDLHPEIKSEYEILIEQEINDDVGIEQMSMNAFYTYNKTTNEVINVYIFNTDDENESTQFNI